MNRIEFIRRVGKSGKISLPRYVADYYKGKIVKISIEILDKNK